MLRLEIITNSRTRSTKHLQIVNVREVDWEAWPLSEDERVRLYLLRVCVAYTQYVGKRLCVPMLDVFLLAYQLPIFMCERKKGKQCVVQS